MAENAALFLPSVSEKSKHTFCLLPNLQSALHFSLPHPFEKQPSRSAAVFYNLSLSRFLELSFTLNFKLKYIRIANGRKCCPLSATEKSKYTYLVYTKTVDSVERARWLARRTPNILHYLPPSNSGKMSSRFASVASEEIIQNKLFVVHFISLEETATFRKNKLKAIVF